MTIHVTSYHPIGMYAERVWNLEWGENMYLGWYLVVKECGNIYLDIDVTTGSEVSGIRDGTATMLTDESCHVVPISQLEMCVD